MAKTWPHKLIPSLVLLVALAPAADTRAQAIAANLGVCKGPWKTDFRLGRVSRARSNAPLLFTADESPVAGHITAALAHSARYYKKLGFNSPATLCLDNGEGPYAIEISPSVLWAVTTNERTSQGRAGIMKVHPCLITAHKKQFGLPVQSDEASEFAVCTANDASPGTVNAAPLYAAQHEVVHAILINAPVYHRTDAEFWLEEGFAEALSVLWYESYRHGAGWPAIKEEDFHVHYLDTSLHHPDGPENDEVSASYGTFRFWQLLMQDPEVITANSMADLGGDFSRMLINPGNLPRSVIDTYMMRQYLGGSVSESQRRGDWEMRYLDGVMAPIINQALLKQNSTLPPVKGGMYVAYPKYVARFALALASKPDPVKAFKRYFKLRTGCHQITLDQKKPVPSDPVPLPALASACFEVNLSASPGNTPFTVRGKSGDFGVLEQIHLGWSGNDHPPVKFVAGEKTWHVSPPVGVTKIWLTASNAAPSAADTADTTVVFVFTFQAQGKGTKSG